MTAIHISMTGHLAGVTFCGGGDPDAPLPPDMRFASHLPYLSKERMDVFVRDHIVCLECKKVYEECTD